MPGFDPAARSRLTRALKAEARRLGFDGCGISQAQRLDPEAERLEQWLLQGRQGSMHWMEGHFEKRVDPRLLVDGARSVVSVLHNYHPAVEPATGPEFGRISQYAWGDDYHDVLKERLAGLFDWLDRETGGAGGRVFVDSAPVMDKAWAQRSGLGWIGKHTNLISPTLGSYFFIGEMIVDVPLDADSAAVDHCGSCTRCIDACPTDAIDAPYQLDAQRCIAYLTIEHRADDIDQALASQIGNWIFGCDICQEVCPWNKFSRPTAEERYAPRPGMADTSIQDWEELDLEAFRLRFRRNPVKRTKFEGFRRNIRMAALNRENGPGA
jgi:epoxyqueuosine reductase